MQKHLGQRQTRFYSDCFALTPSKRWKSWVLGAGDRESGTACTGLLIHHQGSQPGESLVKSNGFLGIVASPITYKRSPLLCWGNLRNKMRHVSLDQYKRENVQTFKLLLETSLDHSDMLPIRTDRKRSHEFQDFSHLINARILFNIKRKQIGPRKIYYDI